MKLRLWYVIPVVLILYGLFALGGFAAMASTTEDVTERDRAIASSTSACDGNEASPGFNASSFRMWSQQGGFNLSINETAVEPGEPIHISLRNTAMIDQSTGVKSMYALQKPYKTGWKTMTEFRGPRTDFPARNVSHEPGTGFDWTFRANASGFSKGQYVVCEALEPGVYRFVYAGSDGPLKVRFEITERGNETLEESP